ncbi:MAG: DUF362 domain-containing protein [Desulfotalea sp.]
MPESSKVYFWNMRTTQKGPYDNKMRKLLKSVKATENVDSGDLLALKTHFGELGNTTFLRPIWLKPIIKYFRKAGAKPFLTDTSTLYVGERGNAAQHHMCAAENGFDPLLLRAPIIISDGLKGDYEEVVKLDNTKTKHFSEAYIAADIAKADGLVTISHFKGHELAGFGGALKNMGMGCASKKGKMQQHCTSGPKANIHNCIGCALCIELCNHEALNLNDEKKIIVDHDRCVGCGACFLACKHNALKVNWETGIQDFLEKMMEYTLAVIQTQKKPIIYINFAVNITPECDCASWSDAPICPDLGVFISTDPVAIDQACIDMASKAPVIPTASHRLPVGYKTGDCKFTAIHDKVPTDMGLAYAEEIGIGSRSYQLVTI